MSYTTSKPADGKPGDMQAVIEAAREGVVPTEVKNAGSQSSVFYVPKSDRFVSMEVFAHTPDRKRGMVTVFDVASFNAYLRDHGEAGRTAVFIDRNVGHPTVHALLNGPERGETEFAPGWGDHRLALAFRRTPQWDRWRGIDGKLMGQTEFAEFVEDNVEDIADPAGAAMIEIASQLSATRVTSFRRAVRLSDGQVQLEHIENTDAKVGPGAIAIPETITLALAPFLGCPLYRIPARFRYRLEDGKLRMGVKLQRIEDLMRTVLDDVVAKIERSENISVFEGQAPDPVEPLSPIRRD